MLLAQLIGKKIVCITVAPVFVQPIEAMIRLHGWEHRVLSYQPVRTLDISSWPSIVDAANGRPDRWVEMFDQAAQQAVRDGADVVICGCNPGGALLHMSGYREVVGTGVPVITGPSAMVKMAEMMVDLQRSIGLAKSEAVLGAYSTTPGPILDELQGMANGLFRA